MKYCANCGNRCADNLAFCNSCGAPLQQAQPVYAAAPELPGKGFGVASMVLGIISLALFCFWYLALPCAIVSLILGSIGTSKAKQVGMKNGMATAGIVLSCVALGLALLIVVIGAGFLAELGLL